MSAVAFSFADNSVAEAYDRKLVPMLFDPWAQRLIETQGPWKGLRVLDLATGTGIVAQHLARAVGPGGSVVGADMNAEMLAQAKVRCAQDSNVRFVESSACPLDLEDESFDVVVCQQGFQFFPERLAAAREMLRVLKPGGRLVITTWRPLQDCHIFHAVFLALQDIEEPEIAELIRVPFDFMPEDELTGHITQAGFRNVALTQEAQHIPLVFEGDVNTQVVDAGYSTPIAPKVSALPKERQGAFQAALIRRMQDYSPQGDHLGSMTTNLITAVK